MKNRSFRRWLTLVLVLAMLLGILPAVAGGGRVAQRLRSGRNNQSGCGRDADSVKRHA